MQFTGSSRIFCDLIEEKKRRGNEEESENRFGKRRGGGVRKGEEQIIALFDLTFYSTKARSPWGSKQTFRLAFKYLRKFYFKPECC